MSNTFPESYDNCTCVCHTLGGSHAVACCSPVNTELESLREQVRLAHEILASEPMIWIIVGANHLQSHIDHLKPAVQNYWDKYGNYFKGDKE